jgi:penicillin-binding protein 1C
LAITVPVCVAMGSIVWVWARLEPLPLARAEVMSVTVLDRHDRLLRAYAATDGR